MNYFEREMVQNTKEIGRSQRIFQRERERERERERRDSGQREGDGTRDKIKREKRAKQKENMMFDCWVYKDVQASWPEHTYW